MKTETTLLPAIVAAAIYAWGLFVLVQNARHVFWVVTVQSQPVLEELEMLL